MASPLVGAWEGSGGRFRGMMIFTETHASGHFVAENRQPFQGDQPTEAEAAEAYRTLLGATGPYTLSGSTLTLERRYSRTPHQVPNVTAEYEVSIDGEQLSMKEMTLGITFMLHKVG